MTVKTILEARDPDGVWHLVERGALPITSDYWGAELRVRWDESSVYTLERLVERWYEKAEKMREEGYDASYHATRSCADELAKILEEGIDYDQLRHGAGQDMLKQGGDK